MSTKRAKSKQQSEVCPFAEDLRDKLAIPENSKSVESALLYVFEVVPDLRDKVTQNVWEKGLDRGFTLGLRSAILSVLGARNLDITLEHFETLITCKDAHLLRRWLDNVVRARAISDISFD